MLRQQLLKINVSVHVEKEKTGAAHSDDFTNEYRAVVKELLTLKRKNAVKSGNFDNPVLNRVVEQAVMRIVYVGQKQKMAPSKDRWLQVAQTLHAASATGSLRSPLSVVAAC